jgi:hypothetical protein
MKAAVSHILAFAILSISAVSCKKSGAVDEAPKKSKTELLAQASWKIQSVGIDADKNGVAETDASSQVPPCQFDNTYTFKTDSTGIMDEGSSVCTTGDPQTKPFTWMLKNNETVLSGTFSFTDDDASIVSISDTTLVIGYDDDFGTGTSYHIIAVLKH